MIIILFIVCKSNLLLLWFFSWIFHWLPQIMTLIVWAVSWPHNIIAIPEVAIPICAYHKHMPYNTAARVGLQTMLILDLASMDYHHQKLLYLGQVTVKFIWLVQWWKITESKDGHLISMSSLTAKSHCTFIITIPRLFKRLSILWCLLTIQTQTYM